MIGIVVHGDVSETKLRRALRKVRDDLVDLPGYGYAQRSKAERRSWGPLIEGFLTDRPGLRGAIVILDVRRGAQDDDIQLLEFLESVGVTPILVATKIDKLPASKRKPALAKLQGELRHRLIPYSSVSGDERVNYENGMGNGPGVYGVELLGSPRSNPLAA